MAAVVESVGDGGVPTKVRWWRHTVLGLSRIDAQGLGLGRASSELQVVSLLETVCGGFGGGERRLFPNVPI